MRRLGLATLLGVVAAVALAGCTGDPGTAPSPGPTGPTGTAPTSETAPGPTTTTAPPADVDCEALTAARERLTAATNAELERLGIDRSDPRAFSVQVIVTSQQAAEYWAAVRDAVGPGEAELRADADTVVAYWEPLDDDLDAISLPDAGEASIAEATQRYVEISEQHPDDQVVPAQERLTAGLDAACGEVVTP